MHLYLHMNIYIFTYKCIIYYIIYIYNIIYLWTVRQSNQSILKEITPENSLGGLMLKLKFQYFGHLM